MADDKTKTGSPDSVDIPGSLTHRSGISKISFRNTLIILILLHTESI